MIYHYDLHIHSVLSPCADELMTPNNIFNMAMLKNLDIIAITDHNSMKQLTVCNELSKSYDLLFVPGVELTLSEGIDVLVYFKSMNQALSFDTMIEPLLKKTHFDESYYGTQEIMDINDQTIYNYPYLLIEPLRLSMKDLNDLLRHYDTFVVVPHIERQPSCVTELFKHINIHAVETKDDKSRYRIVHNSDAHQLFDINEVNDNNEIPLESLTLDALFAYFNHG